MSLLRRMKSVLWVGGHLSRWSSPVAGAAVRNLSVERTNYVSVTTDPEFKEIAIVKMQKKPVNSFCVNHMKEFTKTFKDLNNNETIRAAIITSAFPGIFSAGLDLMSMYGRTDEEEIYQFWTALQSMWLEVYGSRLITVAAINGHSPAGGCLVALTTDYRIMAEGKYMIGLNETSVGLQVPFWLAKAMVNIIGEKEGAKALQLGTLFKASEALAVGLVDELVPIDQIFESARKQLQRWLQQPDHARVPVKRSLRERDIKDMISRREEDARSTASSICSPTVQASVEKYLQNLKNNKE